MPRAGNNVMHRPADLLRGLATARQGVVKLPIHDQHRHLKLPETIRYVPVLQRLKNLDDR